MSFLGNFAKFLKTSFVIEHPRWSPLSALFFSLFSCFTLFNKTVPQTQANEKINAAGFLISVTHPHHHTRSKYPRIMIYLVNFNININTYF